MKNHVMPEGIENIEKALKFFFVVAGLVSLVGLKNAYICIAFFGAFIVTDYFIMVYKMNKQNDI